MTPYTSRLHRRLPALSAASALLVALLIHQGVAAQGIDCPEGFDWQRMSGVGCVQADCLDIADAKLSYTRSCICIDGYKGCYESVDSSGANCGPHCPVSRLVACVDPDALCPGEAPPEPTAAPPTATTAPPTPKPTIAAPPPDSNSDTAPPGSPDEDSDTLDTLVDDLDRFVDDGNRAGLKPGRSAAAGVTLSALIAAWVLINAASGADIGDLLRAVQIWRRGSPSAPQPGPTASQPGGAAPAAVPSTSPPQPGTKPPASQPSTGAVPLQRPATLSPTSSQAPPQSTSPSQPPTTEAAKPKDRESAPDADPVRVQALERRFQAMVSKKLRDGYYVRNTGFVQKTWNQTLGRLSDKISGHQGGQCGEFAEWGKAWSEGFVRDLFGDGAIIDTVYIGEKTTRLPDGLLNAADALYEANHAATRVILPTGESYILDYWAAIGDQQTKFFTDAAHSAIFDEPAGRDRVRLIPEKEWIKTWKARIGPEDAEAHNLHYAQQELQSCTRIYDTEEEAFQAWRNMKLRGVQDHQMETIINNYKKNGVWWERP